MRARGAWGHAAREGPRFDASAHHSPHVWWVHTFHKLPCFEFERSQSHIDMQSLDINLRFVALQESCQEFELATYEQLEALTAEVAHIRAEMMQNPDVITAEVLQTRSALARTTEALKGAMRQIEDLGDTVDNDFPRALVRITDLERGERKSEKALAGALQRIADLEKAMKQVLRNQHTLQNNGQKHTTYLKKEQSSIRQRLRDLEQCAVEDCADKSQAMSTL